MKVFVFGAGAHGRIVSDILVRAGSAAVAFVDDTPSLQGCFVNGVPIAGTFTDLSTIAREVGSSIVIALGNPVARLSVARQAAASGWTFANAIHPNCIVASTVELGTGNMISAGAILNANARIGDHVIVNTAAIVEHDAVILDGATICPCACIGSRSIVEAGAFIGSAAVILPRVRVGCGAIVAAGSIVTKDVPERSMVMGTPARVTAQITDSFDWRRVL